MNVPLIGAIVAQQSLQRSINNSGGGYNSDPEKKSNKNKETIWVFVLWGMSLLILPFVYHYGSSQIDKCGIVTYKSVESSQGTRGRVFSNNVIYIRYADGEYIERNIDLRKFETKNVGDNICLKKDKYRFGREAILISGVFALIMNLSMVLYVMFEL